MVEVKEIAQIHIGQTVHVRGHKGRFKAVAQVVDAAACVGFGAGVHKCLGMFFAGMQIKAIVHQLLLEFEWHVDPAYDPPISFGTGPFPVDGLPLSLKRLP